jgi:hypothetical protein
MKTPELVPLIDIHLETSIPNVSATSLGMRVTTFVLGGTFEGDRLHGTVLGGGDWAVIDSQGAFRIDGRLTLQIADGPVVHMSYNGRLSMPEDSMGILASGQALDPAAIYFRTAPVFEVEPGPYGWLNTVQGVAAGNLGPGFVPFEVYEVI